MGSQEPSTKGSEVEEEDEEDSTNSEEESELEALRLAALITKKENDPDRQVVVSLQLSVLSQSDRAQIAAYAIAQYFNQ